MLLKLKDTIINTDHIIEAKFTENNFGKALLIIRVVDDGNRKQDESPLALRGIAFSGDDAKAMWRALSGAAQSV